MRRACDLPREQIESVRQQEEDDQAGIEALILSVEEPLTRVASDMELAAQFDQGLQPPIKELGEHAQQQAQEMRRLKQELDDQEEQIAMLNTQLQGLESRLGGVSEERIALQRRVDAQERMRSERAGTIESSFTPDEARVYRQGEDVVVSLLGIRFPSGRSTIDGSSAPLMQKVQDALALFPARRSPSRVTPMRTAAIREPDPVAGSGRRGEAVSGDELRRGC